MHCFSSAEKRCAHTATAFSDTQKTFGTELKYQKKIKVFLIKKNFLEIGKKCEKLKHRNGQKIYISQKVNIGPINYYHYSMTILVINMPQETVDKRLEALDKISQRLAERCARMEKRLVKLVNETHAITTSHEILANHEATLRERLKTETKITDLLEQQLFEEQRLSQERERHSARKRLAKAGATSFNRSILFEPPRKLERTDIIPQKKNWR